MEKQIIMKVWRNKKANQNLLTIPKDCNIKEGDYVEIIKIERIRKKEVKANEQKRI